MGLFHAPLLAFAEIGQLPLGIRRVEAGMHPNRKFHDHDFSEIAVIVSGNPIHILDGNTAVLSPGDVLIVHPGAVHAYDNAGGMEIVNVVYDAGKLSLPQLDGGMLSVFRAIFPKGKTDMLNPVLHLDEKGLAEVLDDIAGIEEELLSSRPGAMLATLGRFIEFLVHLARHGAVADSESRVQFLIGNSIAYMNRHFTEKIRVETLVRLAHMSRRNFFRSFKLAAGCSPVEYLIRLRLRHSVDQLIHSDRSIAEIAASCGFYDSNFFCKKFREHYSITPGRCRAMHGLPPNPPFITVEKPESEPEKCSGKHSRK